MSFSADAGIPESASFATAGGFESMVVAEVKVKKSYEVAAGASIEQQVYDDSEPMDFWEAEPCGSIFINYADRQTVAEILAAGKRVEKKEGFLTDVPVGN
jgi:hypothetical protein